MQEVSDNNCVYRNEVLHSVGERTQILQDVASDPTLPRTKTVQCAACGHPEAVFFQVSPAATSNIWCCQVISFVNLKKHHNIWTEMKMQVYFSSWKNKKKFVLLSKIIILVLFLFGFLFFLYFFVSMMIEYLTAEYEA